MNRAQRRAAKPTPPRSPAAQARPSVAFARARESHGAGRLQEAEALYRQVVATSPENADCWHLLGVLAYQIGRNNAAEELFTQAIALNPGEAVYHFNLGNALRNEGKLEAAIAAQRQALILRPDFADAHCNLGNALKDKGELSEAVRAYRRAIAIRPDFVDAHVNLTSALRERGEFDEAAAAARRALAIRPDLLRALVELCAALKGAGRWEEATAAAKEAVRRHPASAAAHLTLGNIAIDRGHFDEAADALVKAVALEPGLFLAHYNLGVVWMAKGAPSAAIQSYRNAVAIKPDFAWAHCNLGVAFLEVSRFSDAEASYREAARVNPDFADAHGNLGTVLHEMGRLEEASAAYLAALRLKSTGLRGGEGRPESATLSNVLMTLHYDARTSNPQLIAAARRYGELFENLPGPASFSKDRTRSRLRVGYVSGDFRQHAVGFFLARVLEAHDKSEFEIFGYSNSAKVDDWTRRLRGAADHWREIAGLSDAAAAQVIREDGIDILIDLSGHTAGNRLPLFALRPAPVQASWLGYFGSVGLKAIDYLLMDGFAVPSGEELLYPEAIVRLPRGRFCYAPPDYAPAPVDPPSLRTGFVTFGSFNHVAKISDGVAPLWADILKSNPASRLILKWKALDDERVRARLRVVFSTHGVDADRLELRGFSPHREMLEQYGEIDVALDPFPFGGGLTSCEALWMGVPVVTWPGDRPASRQTAGFLDNIGLRECIASSASDYVARATALASDRQGLAELRHSLRARMAASPLCDGPRFARTLEAAFRGMWRHWRSDRAPEGFEATDDA